MNRGEIWDIDLDPAQGDEIKKIRPVVIVNADTVGKLALRVVVPILGWKDHFSEAPWMVRIDYDKINCLTKISSADAFQVRSISTTRFQKKRGLLSAIKMQEISKALSIVLDLNC